MSLSPLEAYKARQAERERREKERSPMPLLWFGQRDPIARFTLYLGLFTLGLLIMGVLQWCSIQGQLNEMKKSGTDTHDLALAAKLDQRAWLANGALILQPPDIGGVAHASVGYLNTGRTPAKEVYPLTHLRFVPELIATEERLLEFGKEGEPQGKMIGVMYPGIQGYGSVIDGNSLVTPIDLMRITRDWYTYLWGEVTYRDVFDEPHTMTFCGYRKGMVGDFLQCPFHNMPDNQQDLATARPH